MADQPKVHTVRHILTRGEWTVGHFETDMIFVDGVPTLVFEWETTPDGESPVATAQLDPKYLHKFEFGSADYLYEFPVEDPRPLS